MRRAEGIFDDRDLLRKELRRAFNTVDCENYLVTVELSMVTRAKNPASYYVEYWLHQLNLHVAPQLRCNSRSKLFANN